MNSIGAVITSDFRSFGGRAGAISYDGGFFDESVVGTASAVFGIEYNLTCHWTIGVNGGTRYSSELDDDDRAFRRPIFVGTKEAPGKFAQPINDDAGNRWTIPVTGYVKFRF